MCPKRCALDDDLDLIKGEHVQAQRNQEWVHSLDDRRLDYMEVVEVGQLLMSMNYHWELHIFEYLFVVVVVDGGFHCESSEADLMVNLARNWVVWVACRVTCDYVHAMVITYLKRLNDMLSYPLSPDY